MVEVHRNSLPDEQQRSQQRTRQQNPKQTPGQINPEISECCAGFPCKASYEGNAHCQPSGTGQEVLYAETYHLAEIAHGALSGISLPCARSGEADSCIEGEVWREWRRLVLREVPGKEALEPKDGV